MTKNKDENESDDEVIGTIQGLIMAGSIDIARQMYSARLFNEALRQAKLIGIADDAIEEEPEL